MRIKSGLAEAAPQIMNIRAAEPSVSRVPQAMKILPMIDALSQPELSSLLTVTRFTVTSAPGVGSLDAASADCAAEAAWASAGSGAGNPSCFAAGAVSDPTGRN